MLAGRAPTALPLASWATTTSPSPRTTTAWPSGTTRAMQSTARPSTPIGKRWSPEPRQPPLRLSRTALWGSGTPTSTAARIRTRLRSKPHQNAKRGRRMPALLLYESNDWRHRSRGARRGAAPVALAARPSGVAPRGGLGPARFLLLRHLPRSNARPRRARSRRRRGLGAPRRGTAQRRRRHQAGPLPRRCALRATLRRDAVLRGIRPGRQRTRRRALRADGSWDGAAGRAADATTVAGGRRRRCSCR